MAAPKIFLHPERAKGSGNQPLSLFFPLPFSAHSNDVIMPQYAIERLYELTKDRKTYITTEVGQHQM